MSSCFGWGRGWRWKEFVQKDKIGSCVRIRNEAALAWGKAEWDKEMEQFERCFGGRL